MNLALFYNAFCYFWVFRIGFTDRVHPWLNSNLPAWWPSARIQESVRTLCADVTRRNSAVRPVRPLRGRAVMGGPPVGLHPRLFIFVPAGDGRPRSLGGRGIMLPES